MLSMIFRFDGLFHGPGGLREFRNVLTINNMFCAYSLDWLWMKNLCFPLPITFLLIAITVTIYPRYNCHSFLQIIAKCIITIIYRMFILSILFITAFSSQSLKKLEPELIKFLEVQQARSTLLNGITNKFMA